jgi:hypothetical protein
MSCNLLSLFFALLALVMWVAIVAEWIATNAGTVTVAAFAVVGAAVPRLYPSPKRMSTAVRK